MKITKAEFIKILKANSSSFDKTDLSPEDQLSSLGVDSIGFVMTVYAIEEKFNIKIEDKDMESLNQTSTVADFAKVLQSLGVEIEI